jgi:Secretion system C-terminal sorting domain
MKTRFIDKGYAVILGEYGAIARLNLGSAALNAEHAGYRLYYMQYITGSILKYGLVPFYWDNGYTGDNGLGIFNRTTGAKAYPDIIEAIVGAVGTTVDGAGIGMLDSYSNPAEFSLKQNYPNPFNPSTTIGFRVPGEKIGSGVTGLGSSWVKLAVYDMLGREVSVLVNERKDAGDHEVMFNGSGLSSGLYFYRMQVRPLDSAVGRDSKSGAGVFVETRKLLLLR